MVFAINNQTVQAQEPWLPENDQAYIKKLLTNAKVPVPETLLFYKLPQVYQEMYSMSSRPYNDITPIREEIDPWLSSGGLHHVDRKYWRNVTGIAIPKGKSIAYWQEYVDVRAFVPVHKHRWSFPEGTLAYDVLLRVNGKEAERLFEVRVQEKRDTDWDSGTAYRPKLSEVKLDVKKWKYEWAFSNGMEAESIVNTIDSFGNNGVNEFGISTKLFVDDDHKVTPPKYVGTGMTCNACHSQAGTINNRAGQIYKRARHGDDGRFSWHPFDSYGRVDTRWPINGRAMEAPRYTDPGVDFQVLNFNPSTRRSILRRR